MLEVHPPHHAANSWRDFFIHIVTIVVGLLIAVGLEQTVEAIHHRHQVNEIREAMHQEMEADQSILALDETTLQQQHVPLATLLNAVNANFSGQHVPTPDVAVQRTGTIVFPKLAAWDNARQTGATAFFPAEEARMYDRIELSLLVWMETRALYDNDDTKLQSFEERFRDSTATLQYKQVVPLPDITNMDHEDLRTYSGCIANLIKAADLQGMRSRSLSARIDAVLRGAKTEQDVLRTVGLDQTVPAPPVTHP